MNIQEVFFMPRHSTANGSVGLKYGGNGMDMIFVIAKLSRTPMLNLLAWYVR